MEPGSGWKPGGGESPLRVRLPPLLLERAFSESDRREPVEVSPLQIIGGRRSITGWPSGTSSDSEDTLNFSVLSDVRPMIETFPLVKAVEAYEHMMSGKARFRVVLTP